MGAYADALNELNTATQPKSGGGSAEYGSVESLVRNKAAEYDIDPDLFVSLAKRESGLRPGARNPNPGSTAGGLFQFIDGTWNRYGNKRDKFDPEANADAAARMMREHLDMFGGDYNKALAAHHVGAGKAERALVDGSVGDVDVSTQKWLSDIYKGAGRDGAPEPSVSAPKAPKTDYSRAFEHFANTPGSTLDAQIKAGDKPKEEKISISKEIGAAIDSYQSNLWAIPAAMGSEYALQAMLDNKSAAEQQWQESGAPQSFDEMEFGKNFGNYFAHMALQSAPYMLEFMATGFGVGSAAKAALANTAKGVAEKAAMEAAKMGATKAAAQKAGEAAAASYMGKVYTASGVAGSYPSSVGDILSNQHEQAGKFDLPAAAALGVPYAALNAAGAEGMAVRAAARGLPKSAITKNGVAGFAGRAALTGAEAGVMEGSTETGQEVMNQLGRMAVDPNAKIDDKRALEAYKESFIAGGLLGGVPGAAAGGFRKAEDAKQQPPAPVANSPLTSAVNTAQHVQKQIDQANAPAMPDDHREQIIDMMEKRDGLTQYIGTLQDALDKADPASERTQELRGRLSDAVMRRDGLIKQLDAAKAFYGSDQMANIGPQNDPLLLGNEQMMRTYQVTKRLLENPGELDKQTRSELLGGLAMLRNPNLPETTRIDAAIGLLGTMDRMAEARAKQAADRATATQQAQQAAGIGPQKTPRVKAPLPAPAGSFANLAEFERFRVAELANIDQMRRDGAARQDSRKIEEANLREAHLQDIQRNIEANRIKETAAKRMDLLSRVLASNPQNPNRAFDRALRLDGFRDATFTEDEKATIASFSDLRAMQEEGIAGTPNEAGNFGIREKQAAPAPGRYQHLSNMLRSGWKSANKHQLISPAGEFYNLKGAGEVQFVRNKLNQKANNGSQSPRGGSQGGTDQGNFGVGGAGANGPVPQGGGNGSGQANAIPDTGAPAGAIQSSEAVGNGGQPNNPLARSRLTALDDTRIAKYADELRSMAPDTGWAEEGGRLLIAPDGTKSRTKWIPRAEWFIAGMLNSPQESVAAVEKAISGQPMRKAEKLHVQGMMDFLDMQHGIDGESHAEQLATLSDIAYEGESADAQNIIDTLGDVDLESNGAWGDEVESMRAHGFTEEEINEITRRKQGAFGAVGEEASGVPAGETQGAIPEGDGNGDGQAEGQEGFSLSQQTNQQAADEQEAGGDAEKLGDTKSYSEVEKKLINGEINVEDFMSATGLTDDDVGFLTGNDLRQQADVAAKENSPYFSGIRKLSAAIFKEIEGLSRGSTAQSRRAYDANLAKYKAAQDTLEVIAKNFEHPFRNTLLSKLPPFLESRYSKQWDSVEYGDKAKKSYRSDSYSRWVDLLIDAARKKSDAKQINKPDDSKPDQAQDFSKYILISADDISKLRKIDVERVLEQGAVKEFRQEFADWIKAKRPDLAGEVDEVMAGMAPAAPAELEAPKAAEQPDGGEIVSPTASPSLSDEMAGFTGVSDAEYALRKLSHADRQDGDVELGNGRFVTLEQAVSAAKENMDKADWSKPFQFNRVLDIAPIDWNTMVDAMKKWAASQQKTDSAKKGQEQAAPVSQPENDKPAYADDAELQDALSHLGDVLGDVFGAKLNITGKQYGASDLLPAMSKVIELLIKKGFKSFRESVGAATNAMRGNANTKGFVDQITPRQWKAAYNSVAEFHEGTDSEEDVAKYSAEQIQKIIALPEKIKEAEQATNHDATPGQKEAGNYAKGKFAWQGLTIAVETAKGEDRTDKETNGEKWRVTMPATYGYVLGSEGADGDHVDVFMGDKPESQRVYVINQTKPGSAEFDEHKIMLGYESEGAAIGDYLLSFSDTFGASVLGSVSGPYAIDDFKHMLESNRFSRAKPISDRLAYVNPRVEEKPVEQQPPGVKTNGTKEKAAAERLAQLLDKMDQVRIDRNTPEGSAKGIVRSVIEELRKERAVGDIPEMLDMAAKRLFSKYPAFSEVASEVAESLRAADKYAETVANIKAKREERAIPTLDKITVTRSAQLDGKAVEYDQQADEALQEIDGNMDLAKRLLECLAS